MNGRDRARPNLLLGVFRLARFDPAGFAQFGDTREAFLASLAPLLAFPLVGTVLMLVGGGGGETVAEFLATVCALLAPPVLSHFLARLWAREADWLRYATAFNWCQWIIPMVATLSLAAAGMLIAAGVPNRAAAALAVGALALYGLMLHWFLARRGLGLGGGRAALLVLGVNLGTAALVVVPGLLVLGGREG